MSMYRQLLIAIILSTVVALGGGLVASVMNARSYLQDQLSMKNTDNATALALTISNNKPDPARAELTVAALFDSGHYERIRITDPSGKVLVERIASDDNDERYPLLERLVPIDAEPGIAEINDGWKVFGTVTLESHSRFAYQALTKTVVQLSLATVLAGLIGSLLGIWILQRIKAPLDQVVDQALSISNKRFVTIDEPTLPELKQLARTMNHMVERLKALFEADAEKLAALRAENDYDSLTGIANRKFFTTSLPVILADAESRAGWLMLIRIQDLQHINQRLGREGCDQLLQRVGRALHEQAQLYPRSLAARLNGADFAWLIPSAQDGESLANLAHEAIRRATLSFNHDQPVVLIGVANYQNGIDSGELMAAADRALLLSQGQSGSPVCVKTSDEPKLPNTMIGWSKLLTETLSKNRVRLARYPVLSDQNEEILHYECPLRLQFSADGEWQPAGSFLAIAERLGLISLLDLHAVRLGIQQLESEPQLSGLAINIAGSSFSDPGFREGLIPLLKTGASRRLWLDVAANGALQNIEGLRSLREPLQKLGVKLGLEHFGRELDRFAIFYDLGLDYIKVDSLFIRDVAKNTSNRLFLAGMVGMMGQIGIPLIAEGVLTSEEKSVLRELGFKGVTGPGIVEP